MRHTFLRLVAVLALGVTAACSKSSPASPSTPAAPTVASIAITGLDAVRTGFFVDYTVTATLSDGTTQNVTATAAWTSSDNAVATVNASGRLSGQAHGTVTVTAAYQGRTASKAVNIVNNYGGTWSGNYTVTACDASGEFGKFGWCSGKQGASFAVTLVLTQAGNDRSQVSGSMSNQFVTNTPVTGIVTSDGRLNIGTDTTGTRDGVTFRFQLVGFETRTTTPTQMNGRTALSLSATGVAGNAYEEHRINPMVLSNPQIVRSPER
jgi:Bacterial Ig-like domain (group 2)